MDLLCWQPPFIRSLLICNESRKETVYGLGCRHRDNHKSETTKGFNPSGSQKKQLAQLKCWISMKKVQNRQWVRGIISIHEKGGNLNYAESLILRNQITRPSMDG